jgi:hypothetical protein
MRVAMTIAIFGFAAVFACNTTPPPRANTPAQQQTVANSNAEPKPLSELDLTKICNLGAKGRAQDLDYNNLDVINDLVANGKGSIPFLVSKLDDPTLMPCHVLDYWPQMAVGDVAFIVLTDFSTDITWEKATIPGVAWDEFFEAKKDRKLRTSDYYYQQVQQHGRPWVKAKWANIWNMYKDRIIWDDKERAFRVI